MQRPGSGDDGEAWPSSGDDGDAWPQDVDCDVAYVDEDVDEDVPN